MCVSVSVCVPLCLCLCLRASQLVSGSHDTTARVWDLETGSCVLQLPGHEQEVTDVACHPQRNFTITSSRDATFRMWDLRQVCVRACVRLHVCVCVCVCLLFTLCATAVVCAYSPFPSELHQGRECLLGTL